MLGMRDIGGVVSWEMLGYELPDGGVVLGGYLREIVERPVGFLEEFAVGRLGQSQAVLEACQEPCVPFAFGFHEDGFLPVPGTDQT